MTPSPRSRPPGVKLVAHHVGARGFGGTLAVPDRFRSCIVNVLYEADAECAARMLAEANESAEAQAMSEKYVLPYCLGARRGPATLNVTANAYASSVFMPNPGFAANYCEISLSGATYDVVYGEMMRIVRKAELQIETIDQLFDENKIPCEDPPDFLSLDTQGFELEIVEGAKRTIARSVVGIVSEVEMQSMYSGQPLLGDVLKKMQELGFIFAGFVDYYEVMPYRAPVGLRGKAFPGFGDALFLRDIETLDKNAAGAGALYAMLMKSAFLSVKFGFVEYALHALDKAKAIRAEVPDDFVARFGETEIGKFLAALDDKRADHEELFPPIFSVPNHTRAAGDRRTSWYDKYHAASMQLYAEAAARPAVVDPPPPPPPPPPPVPTIRSRLGSRIRQFFDPAATATATATASAPVVAPQPDPPHPWAKIAQGSSDFENFLESWGFSSTAEHVRQRRQRSEKYARVLDQKMRAESQLEHIQPDQD